MFSCSPILVRNKTMPLLGLKLALSLTYEVTTEDFLSTVQNTKIWRVHYIVSPWNPMPNWITNMFSRKTTHISKRKNVSVPAINFSRVDTYLCFIYPLINNVITHLKYACKNPISFGQRSSDGPPCYFSANLHIIDSNNMYIRMGRSEVMSY